MHPPLAPNRRLVQLTALVVAIVAACESPENGSKTTDRPATSPVERSPSERPAPSVEWAEPVGVASGPAEMGPWRMNDSRFHYVDDPTVRFLSNDTVGVSWVDNERQNVYFQKFDADGSPVLDEPADVSRSPEIFSWLPKIAVSAEGDRIHVLWQEIVFSGGSHGGEAFYARSTDGGETFEDPINLSETRDGDGKGRLTREIWHNGSLDIALGNDGTVYATWTAYEGDLWFSHSEDGGETFAEPTDVAGSADLPARAPNFGIGPEGTLYLAWTVGERDDADIRLAKSEDGGSPFETPNIPYETGGHSDAPKVAVDSTGAVHLAFGNAPDGRFERYSILYARRPPDGTFPDRPRLVAGPGMEGIESANFPHLGVTGDGTVLVVWERYPAHDDRPLGLGLAHAPAGDGGFSSPTTIPKSPDRNRGINGSLQGMLMQKLHASATGRIAVVNSRFDEGNSSRIRLYRGRLGSD